MPPEQVGVTEWVLATDKCVPRRRLLRPLAYCSYECPVPLQPDTYATIDEFSPTPQSGRAAAVLQPDTYVPRVCSFAT